MALAQRVRKGWFAIPGVQAGDRRLEDQLKGLEHIRFKDQSVLDLGCAEGLIARHALEQGAALVHGLDIVPVQVLEAQRQCAGLRAMFLRRDLNVFAPDDEWMLLRRYDVVLMLAILHKLQRPLELLRAVLTLRPNLCVVRLPPGDGVILDPRSHLVPYNVPQFFERRDYKLERTTTGHFDEWVGYFSPRQ
jgi:2-polyprenyl-3-methyl-5-hydroxy-6-metoxy-1,4-benzoquinol methylase